MATPHRRLYHEPQRDALCGVHALNALAQGPLFDAQSLAGIARDLDAAELALLGPAGRASDEHGHVDDSGNFSSHVLDRALAAWGLALVRRRSSGSRGASPARGGAAAAAGGASAAAAAAPPPPPPPPVAYLLNLDEHWITVRNVPSLRRWYNFDSLLPAPVALSDFHLAAYLERLERGEKYTVFEVRAARPGTGSGHGGGGGSSANGNTDPEEDSVTRRALALMADAAEAAMRGVAGRRGGRKGGSTAAGRWFSPEEAEAAMAQQEAAKRRGRAARSVEDAFALAEASGGGGGGTRSGNASLTLRLRRAAAARGRQGGGSRDGSEVRVEEEQQQEEDYEQVEADEDADLAAALALSAQEAQEAAAMRSRSGGGGGGGGGGAGGFGRHGGDEDDDMDPELAAALAASLADAAAAKRPSGAKRPLPEEDEGNAAATAPQPARSAPPPPPMPAEPAEGAPSLRLALRLPTGERVERRFAAEGSVGDVYAFAANACPPAPGHRLVLLTMLPPRRALDRGSSLAEAGLADRDGVAVAVESE
jgi:ataxin-3